MTADIITEEWGSVAMFKIVIISKQVWIAEGEEGSLSLTDLFNFPVIFIFAVSLSVKTATPPFHMIDRLSCLFSVSAF